MPGEFPEIIADLWTALGLSLPSFREGDSSATLNVDGIAVTLSESAIRQHLVVSAKAGRLSADPAAQERQVAYLLGVGVATLPASRACTCLEDRDSPAPAVMVRAVIPLSVQPGARDHAFVMDQLVKAVSDVAYIAREHSRRLQSDGPRDPLPADLDSDMVVLRP